jgi:hypothetical protein
VTYPGFTPVGNATLVVANVLTCNKHSQKRVQTYTVSFLGVLGYEHRKYWWPTATGSLQRQRVSFSVEGILVGPLLGKAVAIIYNQVAAGECCCVLTAI